MAKKSEKKARTITERLRLPQGPVDMSNLVANSAPGYPGKGKQDAAERMAEIAPTLTDLQERLFANGREDPNARRVLVVLQGMDTAGKGGIVKHVFGLVDPQGIQLKAFKAPTPEELQHDFLWRIEQALPAAGMIGIFDRSQYEDVLVVRVNNLVAEDVWSKRYDAINEFESRLAEAGTTIIKCFLHLSPEEQKKRLAKRLEDPSKYWKYNPGDIDVRAQWDAYSDAYAAALEKCNTDAAPWFVVPSDRKWYRNWAITQLLLEHLQALDLQWPAADFDVKAELKRVANS